MYSRKFRANIPIWFVLFNGPRFKSVIFHEALKKRQMLSAIPFKRGDEITRLKVKPKFTVAETRNLYLFIEKVGVWKT